MLIVMLSHIVESALKKKHTECVLIKAVVGDRDLPRGRTGRGPTGKHRFDQCGRADGHVDDAGMYRRFSYNRNG